MKSDRLKQFLAGRTPQTDADFVAACGVDAHPCGAQVALGVRKVIAQLGGIESYETYVRSENRFQHELALLDFWDSLDTVMVVLSLEETLRVKISDDEAAKISNPEERKELSVCQFVMDVLAIVSPKMRSANTIAPPSPEVKRDSLDKVRVAAWLNKMADKDFVEFFYESLAPRHVNLFDAKFFESRLVLARAIRSKDGDDPCELELLCPACEKNWVGDASLCQHGSHCGHDTICWSKHAICPVCGGVVYGT